MKISFDIDGTLLHDEKVKEFCLALRAANQFSAPAKPFDLIIVTSRFSDTWKNREDFKSEIKEFGFNIDDVTFTDGLCKSEVLDKLNVDLHIDDDLLDVDSINTKCKCRAVMFNNTLEEINVYFPKI